MLKWILLTKSCSLTIVITANGEVQTQEEAIVYVKELDIFLTMKVLGNTPAVLSLGKLCDENGYSYEWINGQKPHLIKTVKSFSPIQENSLQYGCDENDNNNMSNETKCETNYSINNKWNNTRNKHDTNDDVDLDNCVVHTVRWACT